MEMKQWVQRLIDNNFSDLKGLSIAAQIPLRDALVNELLTETLRDLAGAPQPAEPVPASGVNVRSFVKFIEKAEVHASEGVITVDVLIKV
jgi:hypothetical protein